MPLWQSGIPNFVVQKHNDEPPRKKLNLFCPGGVQSPGPTEFGTVIEGFHTILAPPKRIHNRQIVSLLGVLKI